MKPNGDGRMLETEHLQVQLLLGVADGPGQEQHEEEREATLRPSAVAGNKPSAEICQQTLWKPPVEF